jgi:Holliday junction resolvase RusA-like endonuclease
VKENSITIRLPGVPRGKQRPRLGKFGVYTPEQTVKYETSLAWVAKQAMNGREPLEGPLDVLIVSAFPVPASYSKRRALDCITGAEHPTKKPDADNLIKMLDALNGIVWRDDCQIINASIRKVYTKEPMLTIQVRPM